MLFYMILIMLCEINIFLSLLSSYYDVCSRQVDWYQLDKIFCVYTLNPARLLKYSGICGAVIKYKKKQNGCLRPLLLLAIFKLFSLQQFLNYCKTNFEGEVKFNHVSGWGAVWKLNDLNLLILIPFIFKWYNAQVCNGQFSICTAFNPDDGVSMGKLATLSQTTAYNCHGEFGETASRTLADG